MMGDVHKDWRFVVHDWQRTRNVGRNALFLCPFLCPLGGFLWGLFVLKMALGIEMGIEMGIENSD